jgi:putative endonuclease
MAWYVYILASKKKGTLYIWVTSNLKRRMYEHKEWLMDWFTKKYDVKNLVYYETHNSISDAIFKEKQLKKRNRQRKIELIESENIDWGDLCEEIE